jgi:cytochrome c oxidase assembly protein subunit 11
MSDPAPRVPPKRAHLKVALYCTLFFSTMFGAAFAAVPLYDWFCRVTGFGGTTQVASAAPGVILDRKVTVRFDANVSRELNWEFRQRQATVEVRLGEPTIVHFVATNRGAAETVGTASFNVTPQNTGIYFNKTECFCFTEQFIKPGETVEFPVAFFIDPDLDRDHALKTLDTITLSYTFFPTRNPSRAPAPAPVARAANER